MTGRGRRFLADENFNNDLLRALLRRAPDLDVVRAQDTIVAEADDPTLLAYDRVRAGQPLPGVVVVSGAAALGTLLEDLILLIAATRSDEWPARPANSRPSL